MPSKQHFIDNYNALIDEFNSKCDIKLEYTLSIKTKLLKELF